MKVILISILYPSITLIFWKSIKNVYICIIHQFFLRIKQKASTR